MWRRYALLSDCFPRAYYNHYPWQDHNSEVIRVLGTRTVSPLKKAKRKVGYEDVEDEGSDDAQDFGPDTGLKRLCLEEKRDGGQDIHMRV